MPPLQNLLHELIQDFSSFNYVKQVGDRKLVTQFVKWFDPTQEISMILYHAPKGIYIGFREAMTSIVITFDERVLKEPVMYDGKVVKSCELDVLTFKMKIHAIVTTQGKEEVITYELKPDEELIKVKQGEQTLSITVGDYVLSFTRILIATLKEVLQSISNIVTGLEIRLLKL